MRYLTVVKDSWRLIKVLAVTIRADLFFTFTTPALSNKLTLCSFCHHAGHYPHVAVTVVCFAVHLLRYTVLEKMPSAKKTTTSASQCCRYLLLSDSLPSAWQMTLALTDSAGYSCVRVDLMLYFYSALAWAIWCGVSRHKGGPGRDGEKEETRSHWVQLEPGPSQEDLVSDSSVDAKLSCC